MGFELVQAQGSSVHRLATHEIAAVNRRGKMKAGGTFKDIGR